LILPRHRMPKHRTSFILMNSMNFLIVYPAVPCIFFLVIAMAVRWFLLPSDRKRTEWMLVIASVALPVNALAEWAASSLSTLRPLKYDQFIYRFDALLGQPSFALGRLVEHHLSLKILVSVSYGMLSVMIPLTFAAYLWLCSEEETIVMAKAFILDFFLAVPIYLIIPVCGPAFAFPGFPFNQPAALAPHLVAINAAPNGIPSVHFASALLILWFLKRWPWGLLAGTIFVALTVLATLGSGQHYVFDLVCAVPYAALVYRLANHSKLFAGDTTKPVSSEATR
jgi:PAP2 superfamily